MEEERYACVVSVRKSVEEEFLCTAIGVEVMYVHVHCRKLLYCVNWIQKFYENLN